ncbi:tautomerase family protein [Rhizobium lusitanum]|uniref:Phenylpyruvate tautomerase PptA (4-oxalocrotonate tautomerase family) n=1 Tax=Rhizobium lusitanum TaxID=293958 RepID=A0A7X0IXA5_9HYPH|nr:tautomerase family protein [Rhizobium lusitanum]MBB6488839.1 phenylpyruvate tautomerase PptA (4-oxalocrotonate tautomerase family) [Rhizobium lusitanum]
MPLTHIALRAGKPEGYRQAICNSFHRAMHETFNVPEDNDFVIITEHEAANFRYDPAYLGMVRSDDLVFIQITANNTRTVEQKKVLFHRIAELLGEDPGLRSDDVFVSLVEVEKENWSLGRGFAQYA